MLWSSLTAIALLLSQANAFGEGKGLVGVSMPEIRNTRWISDGENMEKYLKEAGYAVDLQNAKSDVATQIKQIEGMIDKGAKVLVIGAIDGSVLSDVLKKAADKSIKVIAYDRLIMKTKNVDYYTTFNNYQVGVLQGQSLVAGLKLSEGKGPFNIELFGGSPDDTNAYYFYDGAMSVLRPYIESGKLVIKSKEIGLTRVATMRWDPATGKARMVRLLKDFYSKDKLDGVLAANDGLARGILDAAKAAGYCTKEKPCPIVTGQDAEVDSVKSIIAGEQYSTIFKDTRDLAKATVAMADAIMRGEKPTVNDTKTYNNGAKILSSNLLPMTAVDKSNYKKLLIDSGYIKEEQLK